MVRKIFEPTRIGGLDLKNRLVRSATWENMADDKGGMTGSLFKVHEELARGGVGLIITGYAFVTRQEQPNPGMMGIYDDSFIADYRLLTNMVHEQGSRIVMQIAYGGSFTNYPPEGRLIWSPSGVADLATGLVPTPMSLDDIRSLVAAFGDAAERVKKAGFDGVEIHGAHSYLLSQFLNPYYNRRTDEYGGSLENRARIFLEVYDEIRRRVGSDYPVLIKINCEDFIEGGATIEDSLALSTMLDERGIDAIEVSGGGSGAGDKIPVRPKIDSVEKEAYHAEYAARIADEIEAPVILVGGLRTPEVIEGLLARTKIELFSLSRPLLCEPELPQRWERGERARSRCVSCNGCLRNARRWQRLRSQSRPSQVEEKDNGMSDIIWPEQYLPGTTDNFASNEIIVAALTAAEVWPFLNDTSKWPTYYDNASEIRFHDGSGPTLSLGARFRFTTFGFPVEAEVTEYEPPTNDKPARVAWRGTVGWKVHWRRGWTFSTHGSWRTCRGGGCEYSPRRRRTASRPENWPGPNRTP